MTCIFHRHIQESNFSCTVHQALYKDTALNTVPVMTFPSVIAAAQTMSVPPQPTRTPVQTVPVSMHRYPSYQQSSNPAYGTPYGSGPWSYQCGGQPTPPVMPLPPPPSSNHPVYHQNPGSVTTYGPDPYHYPPPSGPHYGQPHSNLQWQPSYTGPYTGQSSQDQTQCYQYPPLPSRAYSTTAPTSADQDFV